ncbi:MAG: hypothetical protein FWF76_06705 [Oscillospiraceae bacterium]|nr:hypothetical protein [Oscillospiraceae bacterium]
MNPLTSLPLRQDFLKQDFMQNLLKDSDNVLILALILILIKQKADKSLIIALAAVLLVE